MSDAAAGTLLRHLRDLVGTPQASDRELLARFAARRDGEAFAALLRRHGPTVWGVCQRLLRHEQDAEDAFQATFLVLARKAAGLREREAVGSYLHGVARRTALAARKSIARRFRREAHGRSAEPDQPVAAASLRELQALLDTEVHRLPEKYRAPFVLCCLEGKGKAEVAREVGWKEGTISSRLAQAREQLRKRLVRRGVALAAALTAVAVSPDANGVPARLVSATCHSALAAQASSARTAAWAAVALRGTSAWWKVAAALVVAAGVVAAGTAGLPRTADPTLSENEPPAAGRAAADAGRPDEDPLPSGALCRLGTTRWRLDCSTAHALAVSREGKLLFAVDPTRGVSVLDMATGRVLRMLPEDAGRRKAWLRHDTVVALSADGRTAAFGLADGAVHLVDLPSGKERRACTGHYGAVQEAAMSADGGILVTRSADRTLRVWDIAAGRETLHPNVPMKQQHTVELALSSDGRTLAWIGDDPERVVHVCDAATGKELHRLGDHVGSERSVVFGPDDRSLLASSEGGLNEDGRAQLWDPDNGKLLRTWKGVVRGLWPAGAFVPDGKSLLLYLPGDALCRVNCFTGRELWRVEKWAFSKLPNARAFTPDGKTVVVSEFGGPVLQRHDVATGKRIRDPRELEALVEVAFSPDERSV
jgi:RNA polymerase sigma factor (sigma-70 family)